ncbi:MAG: hypothetical protein A3A86_03615 [Elusimicrobia bacterium RIFCSPLOWO2_01_FULL_60_11]|nr:MAG: hypothetical protein A3A86_03615 [Elusimicrobia bacterium RIFCSPLOWO2_01_FULL_60_11]
MADSKDEILKILRMLEEREKAEPPLFESIKAKAATEPPPAAPQNRELDEMKAKLSKLDQDVMREKERALKAEILLQERENARLEMENMFKSLKEQLRFEKMGQDLDEERKASRARIEDLEKQLEEMGRRYTEALNERERALQNTVSKDLYEQALRMGRTLEESAGQLRGLVKSREDEIEKLKADFEADRVGMEKRHHEELKKREEEAAELKQNFEAARVEMGRSLSTKYGEQIDLLESKLDEARKRIGELSAFEEMNERLKTENGDFAAQIADVKEDLKNQDEVLVHLRVRARESESMKAIYEEKARKLEETLSAKDQRFYQASATADLLTAQNETFRKKIKEMGDEALALQHDAKLARIEAGDLAGKLEDLGQVCREHEVFRKRVGAQNLPFMELYEEEKRNARAERAKYAARIHALEEEVQRLR